MPPNTGGGAPSPVGREVVNRNQGTVLPGKAFAAAHRLMARSGG
jgi:hypothetical protein